MMEDEECDLNLMKILCLNHAINRKAQIVFRLHFFNFELQKEITQLIEKKEFAKIDQIFSRQAYALNPQSFKCHFQRPYEIPQCFHDTQKNGLLKLAKSTFSCDCHREQPTDIHLFVIALRLNLDSLVKSIIFHPRMKFEETKRELEEVCCGCGGFFLFFIFLHSHFHKISSFCHGQ